MTVRGAEPDDARVTFDEIERDAQARRVAAHAAAAQQASEQARHQRQEADIIATLIPTYRQTVLDAAAVLSRAPHINKKPLGKRNFWGRLGSQGWAYALQPYWVADNGHLYSFYKFEHSDHIDPDSTFRAWPGSAAWNSPMLYEGRLAVRTSHGATEPGWDDGRPDTYEDFRDYIGGLLGKAL